MAKYIYRELKTRDGERVYNHLGVEKFEEDLSREQIEEWLDDYVSDFWGESNGKEDYYYWFFGEIVSWVSHWREITEEEYELLRQFI